MLFKLLVCCAAVATATTMPALTATTVPALRLRGGKQVINTPSMAVATEAGRPIATPLMCAAPNALLWLGGRAGQLVYETPAPLEVAREHLLPLHNCTV